MSGVRESLTGWESMPAKALDGLRAIAVTCDGTTIDGILEYQDRQCDAALRVESLSFKDLPEYVIVNCNETGNELYTDLFKSVNILKETR